MGLGPEHPDVAIYLNNLGTLYFDQDKLGHAEASLERALLLRRKHFGETHLDVALSLNNLATVYTRRKKYEEAEPMFRLALVDPREDSGTRAYRDVSPALDNLAGVLQSFEASS